MRRLNIDKLFVRLRERQETGEPINCLPMFGAFTNDLLSEYAFGFHPNWLGVRNFNAAFYHMMDDFHEFGPFAVQFSWFIPMINAIPKTLRQSMNPGGNQFVEFKQAVTFYLQPNPKMLIKLRADLKAAFPDPSIEPILKDVEQLPHPSAIIQEGLRIPSNGYQQSTNKKRT
ncbi:hypothetical protein BTUL_0270g00090 [Botrytis tulipae]|uniref:Uncharacterized protein n=1 Tax=Botrytis tulipae TaxID=87230 RepID=A0A4Z1E8F5_9HELO|nr:hypothetical protein BTUL_0270g00090 [Botrytis tulipae]